MIGHQFQVSGYYTGFHTSILDRGTKVGNYIEVTECLIEISHHISISLTVETDILFIVSLWAGECSQCPSIKLFRKDIFGIVNADTSLYIQSFHNVILQTGSQFITPSFRLTVHTVHRPVRILLVKPHLTVRPKLRCGTCQRIEVLVSGNIVETFATREQIKSRKRRHIRSLGNHVLIILNDIIRTGIQSKLIIQKINCVAKRKVITVVIVIRQNTCGISGSYRKIALTLVGTGRKSYRISNVRSCVEESGRIIAIIRRIPPTIRFTCHITISVLKFRHHQRIAECSTQTIT